MSAVARRYYVRALEQVKRGDLDAARDDFRAALELAPRFVEARIHYANALCRSGDSQRAANLLAQGLGGETRASSRMALEAALGDVLIANGNYRGAEEAFVRATEAGGGMTSRSLHDRLARLRAKTGRFSEALDELLLAARSK